MALPKIINTFYCATRGIVISIIQERNMKIHILAVIIVSLTAYLLHISLIDLCIIFLLFAMVIGFELVNTAIEKICNILRDSYKLPYEASRDIRDIAAGAVWLQAIMAAIIGLLIFAKYI